MWITSEVEIPDELFDKLEQGKLVLFVGAGVSMQGNSNLPNFDDLVDGIADALYVEKRDVTEPHDYYLGKVAKTKDVHQAAKDFVDVESSKPNPLHRSVIELFPTDNDVRIVTTNFDKHFTTLLSDIEKDVNIYYAPALPTGRAFKGLAYIHGNVEQEKEHLILTDGDFGRAYLTEGWARRFLVNLFSNYTVLFIGYSHNDPVMKYLATGLPPSTRRYAFVAQGDNTYHWEHLGIKPIVYPNKTKNHQSLAKAMERWAELMGDNYITKRMRIRDIVTAPPSLEQEQLSYIKQSVKKIETLRYFVEFARDYEWVEWLEKEGQLRGLFSVNKQHNEKEQLLADWLVINFLITHQKEFFQLIYKNNSMLSPLLWHTICTYVTNLDESVKDATFAKWALLLLETAEKTAPFIENLSKLLSQCTYPKHKEISILLLNFIVDGKLKLKRIRKWENDRQDAVELEEISYISPDMLTYVQNIWAQNMKPNLSYFAVPILQMGLEKLNIFMMKQHILRKRDVSSSLDFNREKQEISLLMGIVKDCIAYICLHDEQQANYYISNLINCDHALYKQLAIYGMNHHRFTKMHVKCKWLIDYHLFFDKACKYEVFQLLQNHYKELTEIEKETIVQYVLEQLEKEDDDEVCYVIEWLHKCDENSVCTKEAYMMMKERCPRFSSDQYAPSGEKQTTRHITCDVTPDGLLHMREKDVLQQVLTYTKENMFEKDHFLEMLTKACKTDIEWSISLAYECIKYSDINKEVWFVFIRQWRNNRQLTSEQLQKVLPLLKQFIRVPSYHWLLSTFLYEISNRIEEFAEEAIRAVKQLSFSLFPNIMKAETQSCEEQIDYYNKAMGHPVGKITSALLKLLAYDHLYDRNIHSYLYLFDEQMKKKSYYTNLLIARLTADLTFLYHIEKQWCRKHLLPHLDLQKGVEETKYAWSGFVHTQINLPLFMQTKRYISYAVQHLQLLSDHTKDVFLKWMSFLFLKCILYWEKETDWAYSLFIEENEEDKITFMTYICDYVKTLSVREQHKFWKDWLADFLLERSKMSVVTGKEYMIFLRFVFYMKVITVDGIQLILDYLPLQYIQVERESTKQLFTNMLERKDEFAEYGEVYAGLMLSLLTALQDGRFYEREAVMLKQLLCEYKIDDNILEAIQNEMIRIGIVTSNKKGAH